MTSKPRLALPFPVRQKSLFPVDLTSCSEPNGLVNLGKCDHFLILTNSLTFLLRTKFYWYFASSEDLVGDKSAYTELVVILSFEKDIREADGNRSAKVSSPRQNGRANWGTIYWHDSLLRIDSWSINAFSQVNKGHRDERQNQNLDVITFKGFTQFLK